MKTLASIPVLLATLSAICSTNAPAADKLGLEFFEQKIRPVLVEHCYSCHSVEARDSKKLQGDLLLDSATAVAFGESDAVLLKGKSTESLLLKKPLEVRKHRNATRWKVTRRYHRKLFQVDRYGVPDPRTGEAASAPKREISIDAGKNWWAFQPLRNPNLMQNPVDGFIRRAQQAQGLKANPATNKEKLLRRAYYDLVGLPPTPEQITAFLTDDAPQAYEKVIDALLASTAYG